MSSDRLTVLLSSPPYLLAYALPLLCISLTLGFAGTFLTLDRSRSFPAGGNEGVVPKKKKWSWMLEGGIGGLATGYSFGCKFLQSQDGTALNTLTAQLATFMSLLIPATSSVSSLSPSAFLAIWIIFCLISTPLAGRYRLVALLFSTILGG